MTGDLITRDTEDYRVLRKAFSRALHQVEQLFEEQQRHLPLYDEVYLTGEEVREMFGISKRSLQNYRDTRIIPYTTIGGKFLYPQSRIFDVLERNYRKALR